MIRFAGVALIVLAQAAPAQSVAWLDGPAVQWNHPGGVLPMAPEVNWDEIPDICRSEPRTPQTAEEREVVQAGWLLIRSDRSADRAVVLAASDLDGMCRPNRYQGFVFVAGKYAGTLSPMLMGARTDGALGRVFFRGKTIAAEFDRYRPQDPLCCPSRISEAVYDIQIVQGQPVTVLKSVRTRAT
ncbi:MAG TPA: LppP/LprE family lipoprotein [Bryobacteraceae bacterium]|nr:LppP/LprE family lipoprotein [Bryobacteraceae bacterium]